MSYRYACVVMHFNNVCVHFLSAVCALPSGSMSVQSSQNRRCSSLTVSSSRLTSECLLQHSPSLLSPLNSLTHLPCSLHASPFHTCTVTLNLDITPEELTVIGLFWRCQVLEIRLYFQCICHDIQNRTSILQLSNFSLGL